MYDGNLGVNLGGLSGGYKMGVLVLRVGQTTYPKFGRLSDPLAVRESLSGEAV
jgi:hypothetical protein